MANPPKYTPNYNFSDYQTTAPKAPLPAPRIDEQFYNISQAINGTVDALGQIRRSDGRLMNGVVTIDSLSRSVLAVVGAPNQEVAGILEEVYDVRDETLLAGQNASNDAARANVFANLSLASRNEAGAFTVRSEVAADRAEAAIGGAIFDTTAAGIAATTNGQFFNVKGDGTNTFVSLYKNNAGAALFISASASATYINSLDKLTVNAGKPFPLKAVTRNGVLSTANSYALNGLLDMKVIGAREGKFYRLEYYGNGNATYGYQIRISEYDAATYFAGNPAANLIIDLGDFPRTTIETGPIVTHTVFSSRVPGVGIQFTVDRSKSDEPNPWALNQAGNPAVAGYSWIIHPACYEATKLGEDSRTINSGKAFPLKQANRGGTVSNPPIDMNRLILDAKIYGADPTKYYQIAYIQNGAVLSGSAGYGIVIKEFEAATFGSTEAETVIHNRFNTALNIVRGGGVQNVSISPALRPGMRIDLTVSGNYMLPDGTAYNANDLNIRDGWSWIFDPITYQPIQNAGTTASTFGPMLIEASNDAKTVRFIWSHGLDKMMRFSMQPNGFNSLFNVRSVEVAAVGDPAAASWTVLSSTATDWIPPLIIKSDTAPITAGAAQIFTGGNHGSDGSAGGQQTARMVDWICEIDGRNLNGNFSGAAERVVFRWTNEVMAYNTWSLGRYVIRQYFTAVVKAGAVEVWADYEKLENVTIENDNGLQMVPDGYTDYIYYNGQPTARLPIATDGHSGVKSSYGTAWATVLRNAAHGFQVSWMDRSYEAGDGRYVASAQAYMRKGSSGNNKQYHAVVAGTPAVLNGSQAYRWHGGYAWAPAGIVDGSLDSGFIFNIKNSPYAAYGLLATGSGQLSVPLKYAGMSVGTKPISARGRVPIAGTGVSYQLEAVT